MKLYINILFIVFTFLCYKTFAQQPIQSEDSKQNNVTTILTELNSKKIGEGTVTVYQDEAIKGILEKSKTTTIPVYTSSDGSVQYMKMRGYKIQVFSGNDQRKSKDEAYNKQRQINESFEEIETVVFFKSPRWILRAGNFRTREEANMMMEQIRQQFPSFGKEMYIISDTVKIPL